MNGFKTQDYTSTINQWEKFSSIRSRPRRIVNKEEMEGYIYPPIKQPILIHPMLQSITEKEKKFILTQSFYKYFNDIANIEKDIINLASYKINTNKYDINFSFPERLDALSVIIDESYHAYVALDFMQQVIDFTGIVPLPLPQETELSIAIRSLSEDLTKDQKESFELMSVCVAEHALTNDLIATGKGKDVCKLFYYVMHDHVLDEHRHSKFSEHILKKYWQRVRVENKNIFRPKLLKLINLYLAPFIQMQFDKSILLTIGFSNIEADKVVNDTHCSWSEDSINEQNIVAKQMLDLLQRTEILLETA